MNNSDADAWSLAATQSLQTSQAAQIRDNVAQALPVNPDAEAQVRQSAATVGVPLATARAMPDQINQQARMANFQPDVLARQFPTTAQLLQNPDLARITHDDIPAIAAIEQATRSFNGDISRPLVAAMRANVQMSPQSARILARNFPTTAQLLSSQYHADTPYPSDNLATAPTITAPPPAAVQLPSATTAPSKPFGWMTIPNYLTSADGQNGLIFDIGSGVHSLLKGLGGSFNKLAEGVNTVAGALPVAYDYATGNGTKAGDWWFDKMVTPAVNNEPVFASQKSDSFTDKGFHATGQLLGTLSQIVLTGGAGAEAAAPVVAANDSAAVGVGKLVAHGVKAMTTPALTEAVNTGRDVYVATGGDGNAALKASIAAYGTNAAMGVVPIAAEGGLLKRIVTGAISGLSSSEASRVVNNAALPDNMQVPFDWENAFLSTITGAALGGVMGGRGEGPSTPSGMDAYYTKLGHEGFSPEARGASDAANAFADAAGMQRLDSLAQASAASKLRGRDPDVFKQFVQDVVEGGPLPAVYIDGRQLADSLHQSGVGMDELNAKMPGVADQLTEALATGGQVRIPVEDFATHIAGGPLQAPLMQHLRTDPTGMTLAESDAFFQSHVDQLQASAQAGEAEPAPVDPTIDSRRQVIDNVKAQLAATGRFPDGVSDAYAALHGTFYATQAERAGMLPHELLAKYPLHIAADNLAADSFSADSQRGAYSPDTKTIAILKGADLSTFLHESGHHFLDTLSHIAAQPDAPAGIKADMHTLLKSYGVESLDAWHGMSLDEQRAHHENFAKGFEQYLMEGKAPDLELRGLFGRFRAWLTHVYRSLSARLIDLSPEVRGVFDRMLASEHSIKEAETARAYMPLFHSPEQASMSPEEWNKYQALGKDATDTAIEALSSKTIRDMAWADRTRNAALKALTKDAEAKRRGIVQEVRSEVMAEPVYRAWAFLTGRDQSGNLRDSKIDPTLGAAKLDIEQLHALAGDEAAQKLESLHMTSAQGLDPGVVADMFGFKDAQQLVRALTLADHPRDVLQALVDQRMLEQHGEISSPEDLARSADAAVQNDVRTRFIATELRTLKKAIGPTRDIVRGAKDAAEMIIDAKRVRDITEGQYVLSEKRAAREAEKRLAAGDMNGAAIAKRDQLLNDQLGRAAREAIDYVAKSVDYLAKFDKASVRDNIDLEYREQIDALLDRADLRRSVSGTALDKREALSMFVEKMAAAGYEPQIPEHLLDEAKRWHYKDMPLIAFKGLVDAVKSIEHLGKLKQTLRDGQETKEIADLAAEVQTTTGKLPQRAPESNRGLNRIETAWLNVKTAGRSLQASLLKIEQMTDWLDGRNTNGVLNRVVFRRISDAGVRENDMLAKVKGQIDELVKSHLPDVTKDGGKIYEARELIDSLTGHYARFTKKQMLMLAGNMGNESNAAKLSMGENWEQRDVWNFLNAHMSKADWDFVAGMGKTLETLWPEKLAMSRRLGNTNPEKIAPRPFDTPHGRYEGWYWPMIYDPARAQDVAERGARSGDALFENIYSRANSDTGRMNTRNENYARPILLDLDALPRVIKDEIHDIAWREAVIDADRFLHHPVVRDSIVSALSQQHYDQLRPWLQSLANDGKSSTEAMRGLEFFSAIANGARMRATIVGLGYRFSTILVHGMSAGAESIAELGPVWFGSGLKDFANPAQWAANKDFVFERSGEMRNRMNEVDRDVREHLRQIDTRMMDPLTGSVARGFDNFKAHAYTAIAAIDMATALPTWMGAYKRAMTPEAQGGMGLGEQDAVYFADKTVRNAHGGTGVKDMARVQRGNELMKLFTMFYTFWNHNVNRIMDTARLAKDPATWRDSQLAATVIMRTLVYTIGVQVLHSMLHPPKDSADEESWAAWAGKQFLASAFAGIPIARDLSAHMLEGKDFSATPAAGLVRIVDDSKVDAMNALTGQQANDRWLKHTITTAGAVFALPLGQPAATAQFLWDVGDGKARPDTASDWWNGIVHGDMHAH